MSTRKIKINATEDVLHDYITNASDIEIREIAKEMGLSITHEAANVDNIFAKAICDFEAKTGIETRSTRESFGTLISLLRRSKNMTVCVLAQKAKIDEVDLQKIEENFSFSPSPRTVHQLATFFGVPEAKLAILAGITKSISPEIEQEGFRFAANAKRMMSLSKEEALILNNFVNFLCRK